jgi:hypothetical protein
MTAGNTDPATFVSIAQDPDKPEGWNVVTLSDGTKAKYAGIGERDENGFIVQRIVLDTPDGQDTFDGPVLTLESAEAIKAVGGDVPPIHATVKVEPAPAPVEPLPASVDHPDHGTVALVPAATIQAHESLLARLRAEASKLEGTAGAEIHKLVAELGQVWSKWHLL